jgi:ribose transport system substrate-binding protein
VNVKRVLAFAQDNRRQFVLGIDHGLSRAAADRGLNYKAFLADNDPNRQSEQLQSILADGAGGVVVSPVNPEAIAPRLQDLIWSGTYVASIVPPPATEILNAPQYLTGKVLGEAAADYIRDNLGGNANVVLLTQDSIQFLAPRFVAIRDALADIPGARIVADISPNPVDESGGYQTMRTILSAHAEIDVILGADTVVLGALKALREAGKERDDQFLGGIDGEPEAVAEIKAGVSYKVTVSLNSPVFGYALGQHAADWLEGKRVPQAMDILPSLLTTNNLSRYEADLAEPGAVYADPARRESYLSMYGSICYDTRDQYLNFPWSSESR